MPDYIGATDLTLILPANVSIGTNTIPLTLGEVGSIITEYESELNSAAANAGYEVPIGTTATISFAIMQLNTKRGVAAHVLDILFPNPRFALAEQYEEAYTTFLDLLRTGSMPLPDIDLPGSEGRALPRSYEVTHNVGPTPMVGACWDP